MAGRPSGVVTFVFTDIEGSTRLMQHLGTGYAAALAEHRRVVRAAFGRHGGVEVDTQGDAFFYAFASAQDAVAAAQDAQSALAAGPIDVRMGVHTGEPEVTDDGYVGIDVHRAARICSTAHGGQIVVSAPTRALLDDSFDLTDLGLHRLKDLGDADKLFQLGAGRFPPLRSLNATNLPAQPSPLVGRARELAEVTELVSGDRLVTLTGAGGSGKTRLGLQAAAELVDEFEDGVFWVALAGLGDAELVLPTIAQTLGAKGELGAHIDEKRLMLLLDNLEHLLAFAPALGELLRSCPNLKVLATSRAVLRLSGEREYHVQPLPEEDAVALFQARAVQAEPLVAVREICNRLDGLPLAIELAAARTRILPPAKLLERLERSLPLLAGGPRDAPERQRTLRATIAWSYDLLSAEEQGIFWRLGVFAGGFTVEAAEDVCDAPLEALESLLEQSLLRRWASGRVGMLETVREFAVEQLDESGDADDLGLRHAWYYLEHAERLAPKVWDAEAESAVELFTDDYSNLRAAFAWARDHEAAELLLRLAAATADYWIVSGYFEEGRSWLECALARPADGLAGFRGAVLIGDSALSHLQGDYRRAEASADEAVTIYRALDDEIGSAIALNRLANAVKAQGDPSRARRLYEEAARLARAADDTRGLAISLLNVGVVDVEESRFDAARDACHEAQALFGALGNKSGAAACLVILGNAAIRQGRVDEAAEAVKRSLALYNELGRRARTASCFEALAAVAERRDEPVRAIRLLAAAQIIRAETGARETPGERTLQEHVRAAATSELPAEGVAAAWEEGREMAFPEAVEYALSGA